MEVLNLKSWWTSLVHKYLGEIFQQTVCFLWHTNAEQVAQWSGLNQGSPVYLSLPWDALSPSPKDIRCNVKNNKTHQTMYYARIYHKYSQDKYSWTNHACRLAEAGQACIAALSSATLLWADYRGATLVLWRSHLHFNSVHNQRWGSFWVALLRGHLDGTWCYCLTPSSSQLTT